MRSEAARLTALGDALERAVAADVARAHRRTVRRRVAAGAVALAVAVPGVALAASLLSPDDVARFMLAGIKFLVGTQPTCTTVRAAIEYKIVGAGLLGGYAPSPGVG